MLKTLDAGAKRCYVYAMDKGRSSTSTLILLRVFLGVSIVLLLTGRYVPRFQYFIYGFAVGILISAFVLLFTADSLTGKQDVRRRDSDVQDLRLS
jgi:hypothetical protein